MREKILRPGQPAKHMRTGLIILTVLLVFLLLPVRSHAAVYKDKWVNKKDRYYYYDARGQRLKGIRKIGKHTYYLDSKGVQHTGWRKIKRSIISSRLITDRADTWLSARRSTASN